MNTNKMVLQTVKCGQRAIAAEDKLASNYWTVIFTFAVLLDLLRLGFGFGDCELILMLILCNIELK